MKSDLGYFYWRCKVPDPVAKALQVLNEALDLDPEAVTRLVNLRVECNAGLAGHPTIQVGAYHGVVKIGILGLINGVVGDSPTGVIGAKGTIDRASGQFIKVRAFVDLREEKVDVIA
jgi:hypothetical protein